MNFRLANYNKISGIVNIKDYIYKPNISLNKNLYLLSDYNGLSYKIKYYFKYTNTQQENIKDLENYINNYGKL